MPFIRWTDAAVAADLIDAPVYFQRMIVWIAKLDRDLTSGSAPAFEVDLGATLSEAIACGDHLAQGGVVAVFPEGTRAWRFGDKPVALGAAWLALRADVPLVPIAIGGTDKVLGVDNKLRRGRIKVFVGPALIPEGRGRQAAKDLTERWAEWIRSRLPAEL